MPSAIREYDVILHWPMFVLWTKGSFRLVRVTATFVGEVPLELREEMRASNVLSQALLTEIVLQMLWFRGFAMARPDVRIKLTGLDGDSPEVKIRAVSDFPPDDPSLDALLESLKGGLIGAREILVLTPMEEGQQQLGLAEVEPVAAGDQGGTQPEEPC